jgi:Zn-finger nucleic acid-binding protein
VNCPVCKVPLIAVEREKIEVDYCISCRGLWFDSGELQLLGERLQVPLDPSMLAAGEVVSSEKQRACPRCAKAMVKSEVATRLVVDRCPSGEGVWFDARELGAMIDHAAQRHGAARPVATFLGEMFGRRS